MNKKKFFASVIITVLVTLAVFGGFKLSQFMFNTNLSAEIAKLLDQAKTDKVNILLLGLDKDKTRADVNMIISLDPQENTIKLLSMPRDTRAKYPSGRYDKLNHAMGYKNPEETVIRLVKDITGMPIHYYCEVDFKGFREIIDILGGVEFDVPVNMHYDDPAQNLSIHVNKGLQVLDGKAAEGVARYRATYVNGDQDRIPVQQDLLKALFKQKLRPEYISKAPQLLDAIYDNITTNFSVASATKYVKMLKKMDENSLQTFTLPGESQYLGNVSYFIYDRTATEELVLREFGYPEEEAKKLKEAEKEALKEQ